MNLCESCGREMNSEEDYGTEEDGMLNNEYCFECYKNGDFTFKGTFEEFLEKEITKTSKSLGISPKEAEDELRKKLLHLKRWTNSSNEEEEFDFLED